MRTGVVKIGQLTGRPRIIRGHTLAIDGFAAEKTGFDAVD
jgi:hypothetical protein